MSEKIGREDVVRLRERNRQPLEMPAPGGDAVKADDARRLLVAPGMDVQTTAHGADPARSRRASAVAVTSRARRRHLGPHPHLGAASPLESR